MFDGEMIGTPIFHVPCLFFLGHLFPLSKDHRNVKRGTPKKVILK